jgi:hypothetical protein
VTDVSSVSQVDRKKPRRKISVAGRYVLADGREGMCAVIDASGTGLAIVGPDSGDIGDKVTVSVDRVGRVSGEIVRQFLGGFAIKFEGHSRATEAFADLIARVSKLPGAAETERRKQPRITLAVTGRYILEDRRVYHGIVVNASATGLALLGPQAVKLGEKVVVHVDDVGRAVGEVARYIAGGFAIKFAAAPSHAVQEFGRRVARRLELN